jgi:hypothetical protein
MTIERINLGSTANDGTGDALRVAFQKINNNFAELNSSGSAAGISGPDWSVQFREGNDITSVAYLGGTYIAVAKPTRVLTSTDAGAWSFNDTPTTNELNAIISNGSEFIAVGNNGEIQTTTDGVTWAAQVSPTTDNLLAIAYNGDTVSPQYIAVGANGTVITSSDAVTWAQSATTDTDTLRSIVWSSVNSVWVAVGDSGSVLLSVSGAVWSSQTSGTTENLYGVATNGTSILAVGTAGTIISSADAVTWSAGTSGTTEDLTSLAFYDVVGTAGTASTSFVVGANGTVITSTDFGTWDATSYVAPVELTQDLFSVTVANGLLIATGHNGSIVQFINGELVLDSVSAGSSGSSKFLFNESANLISVATDIVPQTDEVWSLGANGNAWGNVWVSGDSRLHIGDTDVRATTQTAVYSNGVSYITGTTVTLHETGNVSNLANITVKHVAAETMAVTGDVSFVNVAITGTATIANLVATDANISNLVANTINANGVVADGGNLTVAGDLTANTANVTFDLGVGGNITAVGNVTADFYHGNGAYLTGIIKKAAGVVGSVQFANANLDFAGDSNFYYDSTTYTVYSDNFVGNVTGNVTGDLTGNVTGDVTGNVTGDLTGNVTGNISGDQATFGNITVTYELTGNTANFTATTTTTADIATLSAGNLDANIANANVGNIANLTSSNATIANLTAGNIDATVANVATLRADDEFVTNSTIDNLVATVATIPTLTSTTATVDTLNATTATIPTLNSTTITASQVTATTFGGNLVGNVQATTIVASGNIDAANFNGIFNGNLFGNVDANTVRVNVFTGTTSHLGIADASTVTAQTFTGNLVATTVDTGNLVATGNISALNGTFTSNVHAVTVYATTLRGNLVGNVTGNVVGNLTAMNIAVSGNANIDNINGNSATFTGNIQAGNAQFLVTTVSNLVASGNISTQANVVANHVYANLITGTLTTATQSNITALGTLDNLAVSGNANINRIFANALTVAGNIAGQNMTLSGNLSVAGDITYTNVNNITVESPLIDLGGGPAGALLTANDGFDRGLIQNYFTTSAQAAYMGWKNDEQKMVFAARSSVSNDVVTVSQLADIKAANATLANITGTNATLTGDLTVDDITGNRLTANYFFGDGRNITNLGVMSLVAGSNVTVSNVAGTWTISASLPNVAGLIDHAVQFADSNGNLDSHANLQYYKANSSLVVTGNTYSTDFYGNFNGTLYGDVDGGTGTFSGPVTALSFNGDLNGNVAGNVAGNITGAWGNFSANLNSDTLAVVGNATVGNISASKGTFTTIQGSLTTADQSNITKIGSLSSLIVTGNASVGNLVGANLVSANYLHGVLDATSAAQPNITSVGLLTTLSVNGPINGKDITSNTRITAPSFTGNLTGNVIGNLTGNVTGNLSGATATLTGDVTIGGDLGVTGNISGANVDGGNLVVANYFTGVITTAASAQPNITSIGSLTSLTVTGPITAGSLTSTGTVSGSLLTGTLTTAAQPNITSVGNLTGLVVSGNLQTNNANLGNLAFANYVGGTLTTAAQPNITSVGTLTSLAVGAGGATIAGTLNGSNAVFTANVGANNLTVSNTTSTANIIATNNSNLGNIRITGSNITEVGNAVGLNFIIKSNVSPMLLRVPNSQITNANAVSMTLTTGWANGNAFGGNLNLTTGDGNTANAGAINILSGSGQVVGSLGGNINIIAGNTIGSPDTTNGANIYIQSGNTINEDAGAVIIRGGNATGSYLFGGNIYLTPGLGDSVTNTNYDGRVIIGKSEHRWPNELGNANAILQTDGTGALKWTDGSSIGGLKNAVANGTSLFASFQTGNLKFSPGNTALFTGPIQTVGIKGIAAATATDFGTVEFRVTPTGIPVDSPFAVNFDMSSTGNTLQDDFPSFENEVGTKWLWDLSQTPKAGLLKHDLGLLT